MSSHAPTATAARIFRLSAIYDLIVTAPLATPWTARWLAQGFAALHDALGLPGQRPALVGAVAVLLANMVGTVVVIWSIVRIRTPTLSHGIADTIGRGAFSLWMAFALASGASPVFAAFLVAELGWGIAQALAARRALSSRS